MAPQSEKPSSLDTHLCLVPPPAAPPPNPPPVSPNLPFAPRPPTLPLLRRQHVPPFSANMPSPPSLPPSTPLFFPHPPLSVITQSEWYHHTCPFLVPTSSPVALLSPPPPCLPPPTSCSTLAQLPPPFFLSFSHCSSHRYKILWLFSQPGFTRESVPSEPKPH
ncbi:unnamed protein product [Pleuronectes platessa]|uniref:Uncharacterized protein n=1 Tax=Pleuronectes platessa TaxID=8262 RepID=A0A9N7VAV8_PLEPL|nr:unnamed protein product [Pleuronectes platessa]